MRKGAKLESTTATVTIAHPMGLHLRVGKDVVQVANRYQATVTVQNLSRSSVIADAKSILQLMQLQARQGHRLQLRAEGLDAQAALNALTALFDPPQTDLATP